MHPSLPCFGQLGRLSPQPFHPQAGNAEGQQSFHSELHVAVSPHGEPPEVPKKTEKVLHMIKVLNPDSLAPGKLASQI